MAYLLNIIYLGLLILCSPLFLYQTIWKRKSRGGFAEKLLGFVPVRHSDEFCVWFHAVSVGEINLLATMIQELSRKHPQWQLVISTTTTTGYALAKTKYREQTVFYCPLDFSWAVKKTLQRIRPDLLILAELELWPNLIRLAKRFGTKVSIINGRLSQRSYKGYRRVRPLIANLLSQLDYIAVQNETYAKRFLDLGTKQQTIQITGSIKFDGAQTDRENPQTVELRKMAGIAKDEIVFLAGSTQSPEEEYALQTYRILSKDYPQLRLILVPRHPQRFGEVAEMLDQSEFYWQRKTELQRHGVRTKTRIILVDTVGELGAWWGTADVGFVGGSMGSRGGQNMIEPAAYGVAVSFGPNTRNFRDIVSTMIDAQAAVVVRNNAELTDFVAQMLAEPEVAQLLGKNARALVAKQLGATALVVDRLSEMMIEVENRNRCPKNTELSPISDRPHSNAA